MKPESRKRFAIFGLVIYGLITLFLPIAVSMWHPNLPPIDYTKDGLVFTPVVPTPAAVPSNSSTESEPTSSTEATRPHPTPDEQEPTELTEPTESIGVFVPSEPTEPTIPESDEPEDPVIYQSLGEFKLTAYCPCKKCSGKWGKITYTGTEPLQWRTIAVDPSVIELGSLVKIGETIYLAEDTGGKWVQGKHIDIYFESHEDAVEFGEQYAEIFLVKDAE